MPLFGIGRLYLCSTKQKYNIKNEKIMTLWKIEAKNNWNWGKGKELVKGMFVETPTPATAPPLGQVKFQETIVRLFNAKYGTKFDKSKINSSYFICTKI
ncbi:hypothetical protein HQ36_05990 [Porphyromonas gingivicanis]|uniref:Uncharacterized protein n=2 Tax=Porphyromonas gingivicanis TaxID=266762 RepID=A0A0A2G2K5_9PORP|nr:hypothetical protein HQ36_05990 [Porphyromonas gingivicanis]